MCASPITGQACTLIEVAGKKILTDPWLTEGAYSGTWFHTHVLAEAGVTPESFPKHIDYLFLSHEHEDHLDPESLRHFPCRYSGLICKFATPKFRRYLEYPGSEKDSGDPGGRRSLTWGMAPRLQFLRLRNTPMTRRWWSRVRDSAY